MLKEGNLPRDEVAAVMWAVETLVYPFSVKNFTHTLSRHRKNIEINYNASADSFKMCPKDGGFRTIQIVAEESRKEVVVEVCEGTSVRLRHTISCETERGANDGIDKLRNELNRLELPDLGFPIPVAKSREIGKHSQP